MADNGEFQHEVQSHEAMWHGFMRWMKWSTLVVGLITLGVVLLIAS